MLLPSTMPLMFSPRRVLSAGLLILVGTLLLAGCNGGGMGTDGSDTSGPSFDTGNIAPGGSFSFTFQGQGAEYYCTIHGDDMEGTVTVDEDADASGTVDVSMKNTSYNPKQITVQPGTEVVWTNNDSFDHTVTSGNPPSGGGGY